MKQGNKNPLLQVQPMNINMKLKQVWDKIKAFVRLSLSAPIMLKTSKKFQYISHMM